MQKSRDLFRTKIGLIFAMAGSAVGLGNFLRFPVQAAKNGGGAFIIPYIVAFIFLGIPLMWCEWAMGRYGGVRGTGTTPGIFRLISKNKFLKYLGVLGLFLPLTVLIYYVYIESWTLAYSFFSLNGKYFGILQREEMGTFLASFQTGGKSVYFNGLSVAYMFFLATIIINLSVTMRGISRGIELLAKIAMPLLFIFAVVLVVRIFALGTPDANYPQRNMINGLAFIWNPDFSMLKYSKVWLAAAGQMFFTLSVGFGALACYASYIKENDDIALSGFTTAMTNEFTEVILGGAIAIPIAVTFFGSTATVEIANSGAFDLGFQTLPIIFQKIPFGQFFGTVWFGLLFIAGVTSSVSLSQPIIIFFQDEFKISLKKANLIVWGIVFLCAQAVIFGLKGGVLDELDFWVGTLGITIFALIEIIAFAWILGMPRAWEEITRGAHIKIPKVFFYIIKYVTPASLLVLITTWFYQQGIDVLLMKGVSPTNKPWVIGARLLLVGLFIFLSVLVFYAFNKRDNKEDRG